MDIAVSCQRCDPGSILGVGEWDDLCSLDAPVFHSYSVFSRRDANLSASGRDLIARICIVKKQITSNHKTNKLVHASSNVLFVDSFCRRKATRKETYNDSRTPVSKWQVVTHHETKIIQDQMYY